MADEKYVALLEDALRVITHQAEDKVIRRIAINALGIKDPKKRGGKGFGSTGK